MGITILPPCVNRSRIRHRGRGRELRIGLMQVKGLTARTAGRIVSGRPYRSLGEFLKTVPAARDEVENLIRCGAMASFGRSRPELLWELRCLRAVDGTGAPRAADGVSAAAETATGAAGEPTSAAGTPAAAADALVETPAAAGDTTALVGKIPAIPDYGLSRSLALEREILGLTVRAHPLGMFRRELGSLGRRLKLVRSVELPRHVGRDVAVVGWKVTAKPTRAADSGEQMIFVTFSDRWGRFEAVFFPEVYRRTARELVRGPGPFVVRGRVESELGVENLVARDVRCVASQGG